MAIAERAVVEAKQNLDGPQACFDFNVTFMLLSKSFNMIEAVNYAKEIATKSIMSKLLIFKKGYIFWFGQLFVKKILRNYFSGRFIC